MCTYVLQECCICQLQDYSLCSVFSFLWRESSPTVTMVGPLSVVLFSLPLVALGSVSPLSAEMLNALVPTCDFSHYTIRYLSQTPSSADSEACLQPQTPQPEANNASLQSCSTIRYSLSGGNRTGRTFFNTSYLILIVSQGRYSYNKTIVLRYFSNIIIAMNPLEKGKAVFVCASKTYRSFNNLYFEEAENIALLDITFSNCGPVSTGISIINTNNIVIDGCTFKYDHKLT